MRYDHYREARLDVPWRVPLLHGKMPSCPQADSTAERDEEAQRQAQVREIAATVAKQKELLAQKMRLVEDQLSRLTALKSEAEARMRQAQQEAEDEDEGEDEETDEEEGSVEEESWDEDSDEWDDDDFQEFDLDRDADE